MTAYQVGPGCIACGDCQAVCPVPGAVIRGRGFAPARIDPAVCTACGLCAPSCPAKVIRLMMPEPTPEVATPIPPAAAPKRPARRKGRG